MELQTHSPRTEVLSQNRTLPSAERSVLTNQFLPVFGCIICTVGQRTAKGIPSIWGNHPFAGSPCAFRIAGNKSSPNDCGCEALQDISSIHRTSFNHLNDVALWIAERRNRSR